MITVGADPEFFLVGDDGIPISAHEYVPGNKMRPAPVPFGAIQVDGTAVEFNIEPAKTVSDFIIHMESVLSYLRGLIPGHLQFHFQPSVEFPEVYFKKLPFFVKQLGCDPDFNAYNLGRMNPKPRGSTKPIRTGAGHLHIGWGGFNPEDRAHVSNCCNLVIALDRTIGCLEPAWCNDTKRRNMYGKKGAFRPKPYGVEYRVLSNSWLKYPKLWPWLFNMCDFVTNEVLEKGTVFPELMTPDFQTNRIHLPKGWPEFPHDVFEEVEQPWLSRS